MGCTSSKQFNDTTDAPVNNNGSSMKNNPLTEDEILMRMDAPAESMRMVIDGVSIRYAWVCQRGYYPEGNSTNRLQY